MRPIRTESSCAWDLLRTDRSRSLDVDLRLETTDPAAGSSGTVAAAEEEVLIGLILRSNQPHPAPAGSGRGT